MNQNYVCKTYEGELRRFVKAIDHDTLTKMFFENVTDDYLTNVAVRFFSNSKNFTISEVIELRNRIM